MHISTCSPIQMCGIVRGIILPGTPVTPHDEAQPLDLSDHRVVCTSVQTQSTALLKIEPNQYHHPDLEYSLWHHLTRGDYSGNSAWSHNSASSIAYSKSSACSLIYLQNLACDIAWSGITACIPAWSCCLVSGPAWIQSPVCCYSLSQGPAREPTKL